jgi:hypothetical protein
MGWRKAEAREHTTEAQRHRERRKNHGKRRLAIGPDGPAVAASS